MNGISLFKDLSRTGFHTSIVTTFSVDGAFYDSSVHQRLRTYGCENNILMADARMLERAVTETPEAFARAGSAYAVVPVSVPGCFHPKLHIRLGTDSGCVTIGSANATAAGWGRNREIVGSIEWWRRRDDGDQAAARRLIRKAFDFAEYWLDQTDSPAIERKLKLIERDAAWLFEQEANREPVPLANGSLIDLLCERADRGPGILERFRDIVGPGTVKRLVIISPYWDAQLDALLELRTAFQPQETIVALAATQPEFPIAAARDLADLKFASVFDGNDAGRFLHSKIFLLETDSFDHVLFGSANCSDEALGSSRKAATNAECSIYRRVPAGDGLRMLHLDLSRHLAREEIASPTKELNSPSMQGRIAPGLIEASGTSMRWHPSRAISEPGGAHLLVQERAIPFTRERDGIHLLELPEAPSSPIIARIRLADGRITSPVIVNDEVRLANASPGLGDRRLRSAFAKIELEDGDLLELASLASIIFSETEPAAVARLKRRRAASPSGGAQSSASDAKAEVREYESPKAFREAMESAGPAKGTSGRLNFDNSDAVNLLRIILRGIGEPAQERAEDDDLLVGETESTGDGEGTGSVNPGDQQPPPSQPSRSRTATRGDVERQTFDVRRAMDCFDAYLDRLVGAESPPPQKLTAEACFMLRLMVQACRKPVEVEHGAKQCQSYVLDLVPRVGGDRTHAFAIRAGQMLQKLWVGTKSQPALLSRVSFARFEAEMPFDCFALIAFSRWAMARAVMAMTSDPKQQSLAGMIRRSAIAIWRATLDWPPLDEAAELSFVRRLDEAVGISASETEALLTNYRDLAAALNQRSAG